jgi:hypothetical protein
MSDWYRESDGYAAYALLHAERALEAALRLHAPDSDIVKSCQARVATLREKATAAAAAAITTTGTSTSTASSKSPLIGDRCDVCQSIHGWPLASDDDNTRSHVRVNKCRCGLAHYCGTECQRTAWPSHKTICKASAAKTASSSASA